VTHQGLFTHRRTIEGALSSLNFVSWSRLTSVEMLNVLLKDVSWRGEKLLLKPFAIAFLQYQTSLSNVSLALTST
jgi:hypothetical protein